jgi:hypothetical protein
MRLALFLFHTILSRDFAARVRLKMSDPKFKIGQTISFRRTEAPRSAAPGLYQVIGHRPDYDGEPSYRIKSDLERHERIARESELAWIT